MLLPGWEAVRTASQQVVAREVAKGTPTALAQEGLPSSSQPPYPHLSVS